ncbi:MAG: hypothetical protein NVSMB56_04090 [Pyrinomonadaceae bacterium]
MDCQKFEIIVTDFARESLTEIRTLKSAIVHAEICSPCARRLAHERRGTAILRAVAADGVNESAPAHVEANLFNAFRTQHAQSQLAATSASNIAPTPTNVISFASHQPRAARNSWKRLTVGAALAACLALLFFVTMLRAWRTSPESASSQRTAQIKSQPPVNTQNISVDTTPRATVAAPPIDSVETHPQQPERIADNAHSHHAVFSNAPNGTRRAKIQPHNTPAPDSNDAGEVVTDFLTLTPTAADALDGAQIVRVEMPHSALAAFGLPFNSERANEKFKADVVLSADGVARAIRFVR